jgi:hypothetical protein
MPQSSNGRLLIWLALLVAGSVAFTLGFACATPLAAFGAVAALTLPRHQALCLTGAVWLASQIVGFAVLGYPWTADCTAWGAVLGVAALAGTVAARAAAARFESNGFILSGISAFAAAFIVYEMLLLLPAAVALSGIEDFTAPILTRVLAINAAAFAVLLAANAIAARIGVPVAPSSGVALAARRA